MPGQNGAQAAGESESVHRVINALPQAYFMMGRDGVLSFANRVAEEMFSYPRGKLRGVALAVLIEGMPPIEEIPFEFSETEEDLQIFFTGDATGHRNDGTSLPVSIVITGSRETADSGLYVHVSDQTRRRRLEAELREEAAMSRAVITTAPDSVIVIDSLGSIKTFNPASTRIFGYHPSEVIGRNVKILMPAPYYDEHDGYLKTFIGGGSQTIGVGREVHGRRKDGTTFPMELSIGETDFAGSKYFIGIIRENTERNATLAKLEQGEAELRRKVADLETAQTVLRDKEAELEELASSLWETKEIAVAASKAKSDFLDVMSHELRTPINGIMGMTELLLGAELAAPDRAKAETVMQSANNLLQIVNDILDFSKIDAGKMTTQSVAFDLRKLAQNTVSFFSPEATGKGIELTLDYRLAELRHLLGSPDSIRQALINLLGNALKFTQTGKIRLTVRQDPNTETDDKKQIRMEVSDTGPGIAADMHEHIFEEFSQADYSMSRKHGGLGLGLPITASLVTAMGGMMGLESELGRGATFWFTLPLAEDPAGGPAAIDPDLLSGCRVLLVDQDAAGGEALTSLFAALGADCDLCTRTSGALALIQDAAKAAKPYSMAFIACMPVNADGETLARRIRDDAQLGGTALAMLAPIGYAPDDGSAFAARLNKPASAETLATAVQALHNAAARPDAPEEDAMRQADRPRILLVEDNRINAMMAEEMLDKIGFETTLAENGRLAVDAVTDDTFAMILMDCQMPEMDGFEATRIIAAKMKAGELKRIPIVAVTANAMPGDREKCLESGMDDYLAKPLRMKTLKKTIDHWLSADLGA